MLYHYNYILHNINLGHVYIYIYIYIYMIFSVYTKDISDERGPQVYQYCNCPVLPSINKVGLIDWLIDWLIDVPFDMVFCVGTNVSRVCLRFHAFRSRVSLGKWFQNSIFPSISNGPLLFPQNFKGKKNLNLEGYSNIFFNTICYLLLIWVF